MVKKNTLLIIGLILLVLFLLNPIKKEGRFSVRCSDDKKSIEFYNKETMKFTVLERCEEECVIINGLATCTVGEKEVVQKEVNYIPILGIIALLIYLYRREKWQKQK